MCARPISRTGDIDAHTNRFHARAEVERCNIAILRHSVGPVPALFLFLLLGSKKKTKENVLRVPYRRVLRTFGSTHSPAFSTSARSCPSHDPPFPRQRSRTEKMHHRIAWQSLHTFP